MGTKSEDTNFRQLKDEELTATNGGGIIDTARRIIEFLKNPMGYLVVIIGKYDKKGCCNDITL